MANSPQRVSLSRQARSLWAKSSQDDDELWLPLFAHACDCCFTMERLWGKWLPKGTAEVIARYVGGDVEKASRMACFLAAAHDIGKATPLFQAKRLFWNGASSSLSWKAEKAGLPIRRDLEKRRKPAHALAGQIIAERYFSEQFGVSHEALRSMTSIIGSHHGRPPEKADREVAAQSSKVELGWDSEAEPSWRSVQFELLDYACVLSGFSEEDALFMMDHPLPVFAESLICGLLIMADWIASNQDLFPLVPLIGAGEQQFLDGRVLDIEAMRHRAENAWSELDILPAWEGGEASRRLRSESEGAFAQRFGLPDGAQPRPLQQAVLELADAVEEPGIMVIEAPMGEGKTEAALAAAEVFCEKTSRGGVCVALPTMATTDAMFGRVHTWLEHLPDAGGEGRKTVYLAHGKAQLNEEFQGIVRASRSAWHTGSMLVDEKDEGAAGEESAVVSDWMLGRKRGMLANFVVCTVDQVLMGALSMKHLSLRQLSLANKVVIIDECHAYDSYMQQYLGSILSWLGAWRTPVIMLSATLPVSIREALVSAYVEGRSAGVQALARIGGGSGGRTERLQRRRRRRLVADSDCAQRERMGKVTVQPDAESSDAYPLITYSDGMGVHAKEVPASGRGVSVSLRMIGDDESALTSLLADRLSEGGCAGVLCDTVTRAQQTAAVLVRHFGAETVQLVHARFIDIDRMENENKLRVLLGPRASIDNGRRPERLIVVGTQVLEQSLDVDFDLMVTDIAPIDLVMQRIGRLHRHMRGDAQEQRPPKLRDARCYVRGVTSFDDGRLEFAAGLEKVYGRASLLEALSMLGLTSSMGNRTIDLPRDISPLVQGAYQHAGAGIPESWQEDYERALRQRDEEATRKRRRAETYLLRHADVFVAGGETLEGLYNARVTDARRRGGRDADCGQRAVRDTQETVEVLLAWLDKGEKERGAGKELRLLPWVGDPEHGVSYGQEIPTAQEPLDAVACVLAQCAVRLPLSVCPPDQLDELIDELEERCWWCASAWLGSRWLSGSLLLILERDEDGVFGTELHGWRMTYSREEGLVANRWEQYRIKNQAHTS